MNVVPLDIETNRSPPDLAPIELPFLDDISESDWIEIEEKLEQLQPHDLVQYCECSRRMEQGRKSLPVFLGYSMMPNNPRGFCH